MKKIIPIILSLTVVMSGCTTLAEEKIKVTLDGQAMDFDVAPIIQNDRVLVRCVRYLKNFIAVLIIPILMAGRL